MSTALAEPPDSSQRRPFRIGAGWPLLVGYLILALPTFFRLATQSWSEEAGAHGPIILATGAWLLFRNLGELRREGKPGHWAGTLLIAVSSLTLYVFGRAYDFLTFEAAGLYGAGLAALP